MRMPPRVLLAGVLTGWVDVGDAAYAGEYQALFLFLFYSPFQRTFSGRQDVVFERYSMVDGLRGLV